ncbi:hypothetical protein L21SP5_00128 [Salinivirga cyanobacteriivorans]|uniref:Uncharacterized protein n=1 Tax=Salinivirga cyanobacteriivorans TaxID=1307839 RepID=A0A0S2HUT0_9BACT|nr:hypothetical protein [Salinivirga cyanobacteriivorans]ALO13810.1 hypothetical protein L21SP5_00128 [Salinivirga cyanobacteriivorans]
MEEGESTVINNLIENIITDLRDGNLGGLTEIDLLDYCEIDAMGGVTIRDWRTLDFGNDNVFDVSLTLHSVREDEEANFIDITTFEEDEYHRNYLTIDEICYTVSFDYKNRGGVGLEMAVPLAQKEKFKDYLLGGLIAQISVNADSALNAGESWNPDDYACNNAVRAFLYYQKNDAILFPVTHPEYPNSIYGSGLESVAGPTILKGEISWDGKANMIYDDLGTGNLANSFEEIVKNSTQTWKVFFEEIQSSANSGEIIVGVKKEPDHGHVVVFMPESLYNGTNEAIIIGEERGVIKPIALEAGNDVKEIKPFIGEENDITRTTNQYRYYKYK